MTTLDSQTVIDAMLRGVMIAGVNRAVFKGGKVLSMKTVQEGAMLGASGLAYDVAVRPVVKQVLPALPLPNGK